MADTTPILSATILIVRDAPGLQVFMAKRHHQIDFASGALVFPGGKVTEDDRDPRWADRIDGELGDLQVAAIAAVRETFEESGLLLCRHEGDRGIGQPLIGSSEAEGLSGHRNAVDRGEESFRELLQRAGLVVALDCLRPFAHWITPVFMPKRFDTHFFVAEAPSGQHAAHDGREVTDSTWIAPSAALTLAEKNEATILFPTRLNLEVLADCASAAQAMETADRQIVPIMPVIEMRDGEEWLTIPTDAGYRTHSVRLAAERPGKSVSRLEQGA